MSAANELHSVEDGDHSLLLTKGRLKALPTSQEQIDAEVVTALSGFVTRQILENTHPH